MAVHYSSGYSSGNFAMRIKYEDTFDRANNRTILKVTLQGKCSSGYTGQFTLLAYNSSNNYLIVNGQQLETWDASNSHRYFTFSTATQNTWVDLQSTSASYPTSWTVFVPNGTPSVSASYACYLWRDSSTKAYLHEAATLSYTQYARYTLTKTVGTGATCTVLFNGASLTDGAYIFAGDVLNLTFAGAAGYVASCTVNSTQITSGASITVAGNVSVVVTTIRQYTLTISAALGANCTVTKDGTPIASGSKVLDGDALTITYSGDEGYVADCTVNGVQKTSGSTVTVDRDMVVVITAIAVGICIDNGTGWDMYQVFIDNGTGWDLYAVKFDNGLAWE